MGPGQHGLEGVTQVRQVPRQDHDVVDVTETRNNSRRHADSCHTQRQNLNNKIYKDTQRVNCIYVHVHVWYHLVIICGEYCLVLSTYVLQ